MNEKRVGVTKGEFWAYWQGTRYPLERAVILRAGHHYDAHHLIRVLEGARAGEEISVRRPRIPCRWEDKDAFLESHPNVPKAFKPEHRREPNPDVEIEPPLPIGVGMMRQIVREEIRDALGVPKIAYTISEAASACGVSRTSIYRAMRTNQLAPRYFGSKSLFQEEELRRWIASLPEEPS